jgi:hypothetical protein
MPKSPGARSKTDKTVASRKYRPYAFTLLRDRAFDSIRAGVTVHHALPGDTIVAARTSADGLVRSDAQRI